MIGILKQYMPHCIARLNKQFQLHKDPINIVYPSLSRFLRLIKTMGLGRECYVNSNTRGFTHLSSRFLQFTLRLGSKSVLSTCKAPNQPGEGVLLHYSYDNGITWKLLEHYSYLNYHEPRYDNSHGGNQSTTHLK